MNEKTLERLGQLTEQMYRDIEHLQKEQYRRQLNEYLQKVEQPMQEIIQLYDVEKKGEILKRQRWRFQVLYGNYHELKTSIEQSISEKASDECIESQLLKIQSFAIGFQRMLKEYADRIWKLLEEYDAISKRIENQHHSLRSRYMKQRGEIDRNDFLKQAWKEFTELQQYCVISGYELQEYDIVNFEENGRDYENLDSMAEHCYMLRDRSMETFFSTVEDTEKIQLQLGIFYEHMRAKKLGKITLKDIL